MATETTENPTRHSLFHDMTPDRAKNLVTSELCRRDFFEFVRHFWGTIIKEKPVWNWHIPYLCRELQSIAERVFARKPKKYDLVINISPGSTKSTICSVMFPVWLWTRDKHLRTICGSFAADLSLDLGTRSRDVARSDLFMELFPGIRVRKDVDAKGHFANQHGGERMATSTGGSITGRHGHLLIVDDPIDPQGVVSEPVLKAANEWMNDTLSTRKVDKAMTPTILIMQRLHEEDPTATMLRWGDHVRRICIPCTDEWEVEPKELKKYYVDGLMDPVRLSRDVLTQAEHILGPIKFAGQFGQSPRSLEGNMFRVGRFTVIDEVPRGLQRTVRYWDKAGTEGGEGSQTAGVKLGLFPKGRIVVLDCVVGRWESQKRERIIRETAEQDGIATRIWIEQEPGSGGKESAENTVRNLRGFSVHVDRVTGSKVVRAEPWSVAVNNGDVSIIRSSWNDSYIRNHALFPYGSLKDEIDASSGAYNKLVVLQQKRVGAW